MNAPSIVHHGYSVRFRVREMKWRRRRNGRARGFYEGSAVYLRVKGPDGKVRDLYLGTTERSATPPAKARGSKTAPSSPASSSSLATSPGGRKRGQEWEDLDAAYRDARRRGSLNK